MTHLWFPLASVLALACHASAEYVDDKLDPAGSDPALLLHIGPDRITLRSNGLVVPGQHPDPGTLTPVGATTSRRDTPTTTHPRRSANGLYRIPLSTPAPPGWGSLTHELRILDAVNVYWLVLSVRHGQVAARPARTREDQVAADATWIDTLVDIAHLPGPYRAQVAAGYTRNGAVVAHFSHRVTALIAADTARFNRRHESDRAETIRVDGDTVHVVHRTASGDEVAEPVTPDESGRFVIGAGTWDWQIWPWTQLVTDANHGRAHPGAVEDCGCPSFCALCRTPLRHSHDFYCPWTDGSHPWEQPNIPAVEIVAPAHTHQPGCPQMQRQPGRLFQQIDSDGSVQCGFCAAVNTMDVEVVDSFGGTTESHERCTHCGESWSFIDMTPVL